jgi:hypothetical protein
MKIPICVGGILTSGCGKPLPEGSERELVRDGEYCCIDCFEKEADMIITTAAKQSTASKMKFVQAINQLVDNNLD